MSEESFKYSFKNDYSELCHPRILSALSAVGDRQFEGYGDDNHSFNAAKLIRNIFEAPDADVHFVSGGTQANLVIISSILRPHEAVIAPQAGHIFVHEAGSIEATGHKICTRKGLNGKLSVSDIKSVIDEHCDEHMVKPRLVYLSLSTESGTVYTKTELQEISGFCKNNGLYIHLDGARLGAGINSSSCDLTYPDIARLVDVFYIGGTKTGALFGEAIVICNNSLKSDFRFIMKQRGALLAKAAVIGIQFETLFEMTSKQDLCLYDELALHSNKTAKLLADGIHSLGYDFLYPALTNIVIPVLPVNVAEKLQKSYDYHVWKSTDDEVSIRLVTSWATGQEVINEFIEDLRNIS